jgi:hypothetical protein
MNQKLSSVLLRGIAVWFVIIFAETIHGIARRLLLEPIVGDFRARQLAVFVASVLIIVIAFLFIRWLKASGTLQFFLVGAMWAGLTLIFEIGIGRFVMGITWERILSDYDLAEGGMMPMGLLVMLLAPLITAKIADEI